MIVKALVDSDDAYKNAVMSELEYPVVIINNTYVFKNSSVKKKRRLNEVFMPSFIRDTCSAELDSNVSVEQYDPSILPLESNVVFNIRILGSIKNDISVDGKEVMELLNGQIVNKVGQRFALKLSDGKKIVATTESFERIGFVDSESVYLTPGRGIKFITNTPNQSEFTLETDYKKLGVGGLSEEFITIFRRAFISRIIPPEVAKKLGVKHVRGMIMYGPPGCGKTLTARTISKMLRCKNDPKIVSGPEIFDKYVGESERKIRELFSDAEKNRNDFHVIIIDELDAICRKRGSTGDGPGSRVSDSIVNQLLAKIDGVNAIDNVLLIGMTNRLDVMDPALLRPGRFEVQIEVGLPSESGREEILNIHTKTMVDGKVLDSAVNIPKIAKLTNNFTGAEIEGLVKSAVSFATQRHVDKDDMSKLHDINNIMVKESDFERALQEITPAFGVANEADLNIMIGHGIFDGWTQFKEFESALTSSIFNRAQNSKSILLRGPHGCGKSAILAKIGLEYNIPFVKLISMSKLITMNESQRITEISTIFSDAGRSKDSIILIDDIERIIEYVDIGPRFSNQLLQCLLVMINQGTLNRLTIVLTTSLRNETVKALGFNFDSVLSIPVPEDNMTKRRIVEGIGYHETTACILDNVQVPIKRFYT